MHVRTIQEGKTGKDGSKSQKEASSRFNYLVILLGKSLKQH